jgi:hypothetical protein
MKLNLLKAASGSFSLLRMETMETIVQQNDGARRANVQKDVEFRTSFICCLNLAGEMVLSPNFFRSRGQGYEEDISE